jgi:hypothetical protein
MAVNTLRRHVHSAVKAGWLGVEVERGTKQSWKRHLYRCAIPEHIELSEKDEILSLSVASEFGDIDEGVSIMADTPSAAIGAQAVSTLADTPSAHVKPPALTETGKLCQKIGEGVSNGQGKLCQKNAKVCQKDPEAVSTMADTEVLSEVLEVSNKGREEAATRKAAALPRSSARATGLNLKKAQRAEPVPARERISKLLAKFPHDGNADIAKMARTTIEAVQEVRAQLPTTATEHRH